MKDKIELITDINDQSERTILTNKCENFSLIYLKEMIDHFEETLGDLECDLILRLLGQFLIGYSLQDKSCEDVERILKKISDNINLINSTNV